LFENSVSYTFKLVKLTYLEIYLEEVTEP